jgi:hypothetical protein
VWCYRTHVSVDGVVAHVDFVLKIEVELGLGLVWLVVIENTIGKTLDMTLQDPVEKSVSFRV